MIRPLQEEVRSRLRSGVAITNLTQCVEELVLNSLDAEATCITVRIDVPNFKIQVCDNGIGIAHGDLRSVGERYSSSKCHVLEDLEQLSFHGFRGEALASIREVCDVLEISTRHRSSYQTYCKMFRNSQVLELKESQFPRTITGTSVTVHGLFSNLPVRRKAIMETLDFDRARHRLASIALINPKTAVTLINDSSGAKCLQTHVCKSVVSTFSQLFGNQRSKHLHQVQFEQSNFKVSGFISADTHHSKSLQFLYVNRRLMLKTRLHKLVNSILSKSELLKRLPVLQEKDAARSESHQNKTTSPQNTKIFEKHGIYVLNIDCHVTEFDICLEPAKTLIEFQNWDKVLYCVEKCIEEFLNAKNLFSNEDSATSGVSKPSGDGCVRKGSSSANLEAFEYKREIETSDVKKSLHSSTVLRPKEDKKSESKECDNQNYTSCSKNEYSVFDVSEKGLRCSDDRINEDDIEDQEIIKTSRNVTAPSPTSVLELANTNTVATNANRISSLLPSVKSFHVSFTGSSVVDGEFIKIIQDEVTGAAVSHELILPTHVSHALDSVHNISASDSSVSGTGHNSVSQADELSNKSTADSLGACNTSNCTTRNRLMGSLLSLGKTAQRDSHQSDSNSPKGRGSVLHSTCKNNLQPSVSSIRGEKRTNVMATFTSPSPIFLNRQCTRKRLQETKEASVDELALSSKTRRLITLKRNCNSRFVPDRRKSMNVKRSDRYASVAPVNNVCNTKSTAFCNDCFVNETILDGSLNPNTKCPIQFSNTDGRAGVAKLAEETCDSSNFSYLREYVSAKTIDQTCSSKFPTGKNISVEPGCVENEVYSKQVDKDRYIEKCLKDMNGHQERNAGKNELLLMKGKSIHKSLTSESKLNPDAIETHRGSLETSNKDWFCTFDASQGRKLFINSRTGHSSFEAPNDFSCTPWLPREDRKRELAPATEGMGESHLASLYKKHLEEQEAEEKLCKWTNASALQAYEQDLHKNGGQTVTQLLDIWKNPVFAAPEKDILAVSKSGLDKSHISVHNVVHPYRFTKEMLASMRVLRQLDEKFIVGVVSYEEEVDGLLVLVDQHAAHERVRLERLQSELFEDGSDTKTGGKPRIMSSTVSPPLELFLSREDICLLKSFQAEIERIGIRFIISKSSESSEEVSVLVDSVPSVFVEREFSEVKRGRPSVALNNVKGLIREHIEQLSRTRGVPPAIPKTISEVISSQACHGAVKFGEPLGTTECQELIQSLSKCQLPFQCAHGRPSVIPLVDLKFLEKKVNSEENVHRPRLAKLQPVLNK
ncbi:DNA mismatch repair protein Mlh3 [Stylophora pistillata]|uniref:DNA mismatch repair protein Mlh3 n=1 Tax=Stylophora pistillata TaxID=50429 RepID=A0A2B4RJV6_STYPI|nr:DNA mismatch repair protein Mlh3 [Stylophora pistillata]